jgi:hypothetical protein
LSVGGAAAYAAHNPQDTGVVSEDGAYGGIEDLTDASDAESDADFAVGNIEETETAFSETKADAEASDEAVASTVAVEDAETSGNAAAKTGEKKSADTAAKKSDTRTANDGATTEESKDSGTSESSAKSAADTNPSKSSSGSTADASGASESRTDSADSSSDHTPTAQPGTQSAYNPATLPSYPDENNNVSADLHTEPVEFEINISVNTNTGDTSDDTATDSTVTETPADTSNSSSTDTSGETAKRPYYICSCCFATYDKHEMAVHIVDAAKRGETHSYCTDYR